VERQKPIINKNPYKNDVFVLGMIMLECGLLDRQDHCYLNDCSEVNFERIEANLNSFEQLYGEDLRKMVEAMLSRDIRNRPDWIELLKYVNKNSRGKENRGSQAPKREHFISRVNADGEAKRAQSNQQSLRTVPEPPKSVFYKQPAASVAPAFQPASTYVPQEKVKTAPPPPFPQGSSVQLPSQTVPVFYKPQEYSYKPVEQLTSPNPFSLTFNNHAPQFQPQQQHYFMPPLQQPPPQVIVSERFVPSAFTGFGKEGPSSIPFPDKQSISSNLTAVLDHAPSPVGQYVRPAQSVHY
jgi:hypothetical protein